MIVDVHAHYHPGAYNEALERAGVVRAGSGGMAGHPDTDDAEHIQQRLQMMEQAGVGMQVLSPAAGRAPYAKDETAAVATARLGNDIYARLGERYPDKFKAFVTVGHGSHAALMCAWKAFGAEYLLPGSDFPVLLSYETYERTFSWIRDVGLPEADVDQILERTAPSVLPLG